MTKPAIIVIGAGGRIGRLLRRLWGDKAAIWLDRAAWDVLYEAPPALPQGAVWLNLAGRIRSDLDENAALAERVGAVSRERGGRQVYLSSAAVYAGGTADMTEAGGLAPASAYGESKLVAERKTLADPEACVLRLGNLAGADAILGRPKGQPVMLDPVRCGGAGPLRSYIGPHVLADVLARLLPRRDLARVINLAAPGVVAMGDLLDADGRSWEFGPSRAGVIERVCLDVNILSGYVPLAPASAPDLVADLARLGQWP